MPFTPYALAVVLVHLGLAAAGIALAEIDLRRHRLPHRLVLPSLATVLVLAGGDALLRGDDGDLRRAFLAGALTGGTLLLLRLADPAGLGGGDVTLGAALGVLLGWHGWSALLLGLGCGLLLAGATALIVLARGGERRTRFALGPALLLGAAVGIILG